MKILFITHYDGLYGSIRSLTSLLEGLQEYDIKPFVVVPREGGLTNTLSASHIPYITAPVVYWMTDKTLSFNKKVQVVRDLFQSVKTIRQLVREWEIDIIYTSSSVSPVGRFASWLEHIPHIWHIREFGDLDFSFKFIFPKTLSYMLIKSSNAIICHAKVVRDYHFKPGTKRVHLVYNGTATRNQYDAFRDRRNESREHNNDYIFAIMSSITPKKGQETAIKAISEINKRGLPVRLVIAGNGKKAYVEQCKQLVETLNISNIVEFKGFVDDPYEIYFGSDCLLVCSDYEALSRTALEAMSTCMPVIGRNSGGTPEIVEHKKTGLLYDTYDELVEAMITMVKNPDWGGQLGLSGWQVAKGRFNIETYAANVYQIIQSVSGEG
jgi:glycosyltransferase involved in cell wall biosynthesis